ncbi:MAG: amino acid ABC transporter substrate-binding protein [Deltaproteobacteria bacterium]|nr:amino acid ABC transporter substrate-binding protein [Deltaproteobacteria bacterium]
MKKGVVIFLVLLLAVAFGGGSAISAEKVLKLGASVCITGRLAKEGGYVKDGYTLWMEEINKKGGIKVGNDRYKVEIIFYDDKSDPQTGAKLTEKLITEDKVNFILGPYGSGITLATSAIAEKYKVLTVACQANAVNIYERGFKYIISILPPATFYLRPVIDLSQKLTPKAKTAAVIWADDAFPEYCGKGAADYAKEKGLNVVYAGKYPKDAKDLSTILLEAKNKNPDILLGGTYFNDGLLITKQMKEQNFNVKLIGLSVGPQLPAFVENLGKDAEYVTGCEWWTPYAPWKDDFFGTSQNYSKMMENRFGYVPSYHPTSASVAGLVLQMAIEKAGTLDVDKVTETLRSMKVQTIWGPMAWNKAGQNVEIHSAAVQVLKGKMEVVYPFEGKTADVVYPFIPWTKR